MKEADRRDTPETGGDSYLQTMTVDSATVTLGRFSTRHSTEAYLDQYGADEFEILETVTVSGNRGTHYRWRTGSNEDSAVVDADGDRGRWLQPAVPVLRLPGRF